MMTETSQLHPELIRAQCASAISNLEENNTSLLDLDRAIDEYIDDTTLAGRGYDAIRLQMEDYKLINSAKREANDSDIRDFRVLSTRVGNGIVLIGAVILRNKEAAEKADADYKAKINLYTALMIASAASIAGSLLVTHYRDLRNDYRDLREANQATLQLWIGMEDRYNNVEADTKNLFDRADALRTQISNGLGLIAGASTGLPDSYDSESLAAWRLRMQELRDQVAFDQALAEIRAEHGDEAYEWVKEMYESTRQMLNDYVGSTEGFNPDWFPIGQYDLELLNQVITDYVMIQAIIEVLENPDFSQETWATHTRLEQRQEFLQNLQNAFIDIFGIDASQIDDMVFHPPDPERENWKGSAGATNNVSEIWINPNNINPSNEGWLPWKSSATNSHNDAIQTIVHEMRHVYQFQTIVDSLHGRETPNVSQAVVEAWDHNRQNFIHPPQSGDPNYTERWQEYRDQPREWDAWGFHEEVMEIRG